MKTQFAITFALWLSWAVSGNAQDSSSEVAAAGQVFRTRCVSCHQPPDLSFATDRAWLDQIHRTS